MSHWKKKMVGKWMIRLATWLEPMSDRLFKRGMLWRWEETVEDSRLKGVGSKDPFAYWNISDNASLIEAAERTLRNTTSAREYLLAEAILRLAKVNKSYER